MKTYSTRQAAKLLDLHINTLQKYIITGKISAPPLQEVSGVKFRVWSLSDVERVRKQLPSIENGRKKRRKQ